MNKKKFEFKPEEVKFTELKLSLKQLSILVKKTCTYKDLSDASQADCLYPEPSATLRRNVPVMEETLTLLL